MVPALQPNQQPVINPIGMQKAAVVQSWSRPQATGEAIGNKSSLP